MLSVPRSSVTLSAFFLVSAAIIHAMPGAAAGPEDVAVHPSFELVQARPADFRPKVAGMDWLPGGRLALATWQPNEVYVLLGADGPADKMSPRKIADGFADIMGLCVSGDTIFLADQVGIWSLVDKDKDGLPETRSEVGKLPYTGTFHEWSFGLLRKNGRFYTALSVGTNRTGRTLSPQKDNRRGSVISMDDRGALEIVATGLRAPEGLGWGPDGALFATDNQGSWLPASKLIHVVQGRAYGHKIDPPGLYDSLFPSPPAVWLPYGEVSKSPTQPVMAVAGPYQGQMFYGDIASGAVRRVFLDKVGGEWQGGVVRFSAGFEAAVHRLLVGKDGSLWLGGLGNGDQQNWGWRGKRWGLQRLKPNGKETFEIKAARARAGGFEIEFTSRPGSGALDPERWTARRWWYEPTSAYGGPKKDQALCRIVSARPSQDGLRVFLGVEGLEVYHVIHVRLNGVRSQSGSELWTPEFWYTLNSLSTEPFRP